MNWKVAYIGRKLVIIAFHALMVAAALMMALHLRYDGLVPAQIADAVAKVFIPAIVIKLLSFALWRLCSGWWRYVSIPDLVDIVKGNILGSLLLYLYCALAPIPVSITWSVFVLDGLLCFLLMSGARVAVRLGREYLCAITKSCGPAEKRVIVVGAGDIGQFVVREARQNPKLRWHIIGFVDKDKARLNQRFQGVKVLSDIDGLANLLHRIKVEEVVLACHSLSAAEKRRVVSTCRKFGVKSMILPNVGEILDENISVQSIRDVKLEDLLGRPPVALKGDDIRRYIGGKRVLVTGAAGSIGRDICRQVAEFDAAAIILFDNAETPLFQVERELRAQFPNVNFLVSLSDVRNASSIDFVFRQFSPQVVFHAAAYKHVPMAEQNPVVTVENNVLGTRLLANASCRHGVERFVMISTDKAVNPTNIMGASKRAAEIYVQALAQHSDTWFVTVRFGNVLGSNGSVVPIFQEQIRNGGPVMVTDREATRFFMTIPEAVQLVLQAGSMGHGGEIFILDMGEQMSIVHLAEELIRLSGMTPYEEIDIVFTGLRPGEKLHEELLLDDEDIMKTGHEKICVARACRHDIAVLNRRFDSLATACMEMDCVGLLHALNEIVPEYSTAQRYPRQFVLRAPVALQPQVTAVPYCVAEPA